MAGWTSLAGVLAVALALVSSRAFAATPDGLAPQRVLLVRPLRGGAPLDEAFNRLRAELELNEFDVVTVDEGPDPVSPQSIMESAERAGASAGVAWVRNGATTEAVVSIASRDGANASSRGFDLGTSREAPNVLAVRIVDLLRAGRHDAAPSERLPIPIASETRPVAGLPPPGEDLPPAWEFRAEAMQIGAWSPVGAAYGPSLGFSRRIVDRLKVGVVLAGPLLGASWSASEGSASLWQALIIAEASFTFWRTRTWGLAAIAGVGAYHLQARGEPDPLLLSRTSEVDSALASVGASAGLRLSRAASLVAAARLLALTPRPGVAIDREYTRLSLPLAVVSAGVTVGF